MSHKFTTRNLLIVLFLCGLIKQGNCQEDEFGVIFWTADRNLEWEDFQGSPLIDTMDGFYLDLYMYPPFNGANRFFFGGEKLNDLAYVYKKSSYVSEDIRNDDLLRYLNVYFDMAAYYSYKYLKQTVKAQNSSDPTIRENPQIIGNAVVEEWRLESGRLNIETNYGEQIEVLLMWEAKINDLVATIEEPKIESFDPVFRFDLAMGKLKGNGSYQDLLTEPIVGFLSVEYIKKPWVFAFGLSGGSQEVRKNFSKGNETFPNGSNPNLLNLFIHGGYMLIDSKRIIFIPRIGLHFSNLRYPQNDDFDSSVWAISYTAGASLDFKLIDWSSRYGLRSIGSGLSLRCGAYYYPTKIGEHNLNHTLFTIGMAWTFSRGSTFY